MVIKCTEFLAGQIAEELIRDTLQARLLGTNQLLIAPGYSIEAIRRRVSTVVGREVQFFKAFLFLLTETTYEGVRGDDGEGWHNDASCNDVNGECINVWLPLYCSGQSSGVSIATRRDNEWLYSSLPQDRARLDVFTKNRRPELFEAAGSDDLIVIDSANAAGMSLNSSDLKVQTATGLSLGDAVIFSQSELHKGIHDDGVRIQLTLKFIDKGCAEISTHTGSSAASDPPLSKHGVLERQLIRELLGLQASHLRANGTRLPRPLGPHDS